MQSRLIVHFGTNKTGSSSIQHTLFKNRHKIGQYSYIHFGKAKNSRAIREICSIQGTNKYDANIQSNIDSFRETLNNLNRKIGIISAEGISGFTHKQVLYLLERIEDSDLEPKFIGYLRDPVGYYTSMFQQTLKFQRVELVNLKSWMRGRRQEIPYYHLIDPLIAAAGKERVHIYPFERKYFPNGNVVLHFLGILGIDPSPIHVYTTNMSLSCTAIKALYVYRKLIDPLDSRDHPGRPLQDFITDLRHLPGRKARFSDEIHEQIRDLNFDYEEWAELHVKKPEVLWCTDILKQAVNEKPAIISTEEDLIRFSEEEIDCIRKWAGTAENYSKPKESTIEYVARMVQHVRTQGRNDSFIDATTPNIPILKKLLNYSTKYFTR